MSEWQLDVIYLTLEMKRNVGQTLFKSAVSVAATYHRTPPPHWEVGADCLTWQNGNFSPTNQLIADRRCGSSSPQQGEKLQRELPHRRGGCRPSAGACGSLAGVNQK